jgi:hypothetical protein
MELKKALDENEIKPDYFNFKAIYDLKTDELTVAS